ncbi:MAG: cytidylate kinase [Candidatus Levybacteria bacterium RBG_16_35_11]|nr:MAG: cytidylate kinase [Candidatus Levybacteria bacterium RBG_16_35_11]
MKGFTIAIDGPVAAGKGTIAPIIAKKLNGIYLDTGAMYRCVALHSLLNKVDLDNSKEVEKALSEVDIDVTQDKFFLNGKDVTHEIRTKEIDLLVPKVAGITKVREVLISQQRKIAEKTTDRGLAFVAEGRDIATKVIPNADLKIFLTADLKVRAERRLKQKEEKNKSLDFEKILESVINRDKEDMQINKTLVTNPGEYGYFILDNSYLSEEETINKIIEEMKKRGLYDKN